jgi:glucose-1-phosphate cytidylyltransferase
MKVVILAGGFGTRLSEETSIKPKPMAEIGGKPILWHIMKIFSSQGFNEFIICCGYKSNVIKEYFANYSLHLSDVTFDIANHSTEIHKNGAEPWKVTLVETGENTMTGGRIKRIQKYLNGEPFLLTYGDGVADVDLKKLIAFHKKQKVLATVTAIEHPGRFGVITLGKGETKVPQFREKAEGDGGSFINGGFFVLEPEIFKYLEGDRTILEREPMRKLAKGGQLAAFKHSGYWQCMDTLRDKTVLESLWEKNEAPWKLWS